MKGEPDIALMASHMETTIGSRAMAPEEIRVTEWKSFGHYGLTHYRIWTRPGTFGKSAQRHEWKREDGSTDLEEWIETPFRWN